MTYEQDDRRVIDRTVRSEQIDQRRDPAGLSKIAALLDDVFPIPGTDIRIGLDPIIGLLPGIGDGISALLGGYILFQSARRGAPKQALVRMLGNIALDSAVGIIPVLGDLFDFGFKANRRNIELLERVSPQDWGPRRDSDAVGRLFLNMFLIAFAIVVAAASYLVVLLFRAVFGS